MYATHLHCYYCGADYPLTNLGSCPTCAMPGQESALNETLGVQYDLAALKSHLDREELARRPAGLWRYHELLPMREFIVRRPAQLLWQGYAAPWLSVF
jgi:threonine synthase